MMNNGSKVVLRTVRATDLEQLVALFKETVHQINVQDYTAAQLLVWAPDNIHHNHDRWQGLLSNIAYLAEIDNG